MKVLVTGANGYIGAHVVKKLLDLGQEVFACDLKADKVDKRAKFISQSIFEDTIEIYDKLGRPDICIHLAWRDGFVHNSENHMGDLSSHFKFLKNMICGGLKHLVVMGSMHEVGYYEGAIDENTPTKPLSMYGIAKNSLRESVELLSNQYNITFQWIRAYYITGDDINGNSIFSKLLQKAKSGAKEFPFTLGENKYDFISLEELTEQIVQTALQKEVVGIINCCSGEPIALKIKVEEYIKEKKLDIKLKYGVYPERKYDSPAIWGNNEKIKKILEWSKL